MMADAQKRKIMRALKIDEISGVDVPAQEGAVTVIMKRAKPEADEAFEKMSALTSPEDGHSHLVPLNGPPDGVELNSGETSYADGHTHPWVRMGGGEIVLGTATGGSGFPHIHRVAFMSKAKLTAEEKQKLEDELGIEAPDGDDDEEKRGDKKPGKKPKRTMKTMPADVAGTKVGKENPMTDIKKQAAETTVADLQAQLAHANAIGAMTDIEKAHFATLKGDDATAYLGKSVEDRTAIAKAASDKIKKAAIDDDPVEYTTLDGIELRKSAGAAFISMAKSNDDLRKRLDKSEGARVQDGLEKRAEEELAHLPGSTAERAALLKAVDGIEDEGQRTAALAALKAQNAAMGQTFETVGHIAATPVSGSPDAELEILAKAHQEANPGTTIEAAHSAVLQTTKGAELYAKSVN